MSQRTWSFGLAGVPFVSLAARWRTCATCGKGGGWPRFTVPTATVVTLAAALAVGQGWVAPLHPGVWAPPLALWTLWGLGSSLDRQLDARLMTAPPHLARPQDRRHHAAPRARRAPRSPYVHHGSRSRGARAVNATLRTVLRRAGRP